MDTQAHRQAIVDKVSGAGKAPPPLAALDEPCFSACRTSTPSVRAGLARGAASTSPARPCAAPTEIPVTGRSWRGAVPTEIPATGLPRFATNGSPPWGKRWPKPIRTRHRSRSIGHSQTVKRSNSARHERPADSTLQNSQTVKQLPPCAPCHSTPPVRQHARHPHLPDRSGNLSADSGLPRGLRSSAPAGPQSGNSTPPNSQTVTVLALGAAEGTASTGCQAGAPVLQVLLPDAEAGPGIYLADPADEPGGTAARWSLSIGAPRDV